MTRLRCFMAGVLCGALACLFIFAATTAHAQSGPPCGPLKAVLAGVTGEKWKERPFAHADGPGGGLLLFFKNDDTGTFTLIVAGQQSMACVLMIGAAFTFDDVLSTKGDRL